MTNYLVLYYAGFGIPLFLLWASAADAVANAPSPSSRSRYRGLAKSCGALGVVHPGFALGGLDLARQLARDYADEPGAIAAVRWVTWSVPVSVAANIAAVVAIAQ